MWPTDYISILKAKREYIVKSYIKCMTYKVALILVQRIGLLQFIKKMNSYKSSLNLSGILSVKFDYFYRTIYQKKRQKLEPVEQHLNTNTLSQVHSLSVSKNGESGESERVITDLCEKQIKMSVSNY